MLLYRIAFKIKTNSLQLDIFFLTISYHKIVCTNLFFKDWNGYNALKGYNTLPNDYNIYSVQILYHMPYKKKKQSPF